MELNETLNDFLQSFQFISLEVSLINNQSIANFSLNTDQFDARQMPYSKIVEMYDDQTRSSGSSLCWQEGAASIL
jgi:hypothetical protein